MRLIAILLALCLAAPLAAEDTMSAAEFDAYTRGKTLYYGDGGQPYGAEIYLPDRRVRWTFLDGDCKDGEWYEDDGLICFVYEDRPEPQCWSFKRSPSGLVARFENDPVIAPLFEVEESSEEFLCLGPRIGA